MTTETLLAISLVLSGAAVIALVTCVAVLFRRLPESKLGEPVPILGGKKIFSRDKQTTITPTNPLNSVISRLTFAESFDSDRFAEASRKSGLEQINSALKSHAADGLLVTVNSIQLMQSGAEISFIATKAGRLMLANGKAVLGRHASTGKFLPYLKDASTGKVIEQLKGVANARVLTKLAATTSVIVGASHMIAGADIAKRLKQVEGKLDLLLAYRHIDQIALLERVYTSAKEILSSPLTQEKRWELWRLRGEVRELRCKSRRELHHRLNQVEDRKEFWWIQQAVGLETAFEESRSRSITEGQLQIALVDYSMRLDQALAVASGTVREFELTLADELSSLEDVSELLAKKIASIKSTNSTPKTDATVNTMATLIEQYRGLLPTDRPRETLSD